MKPPKNLTSCCQYQLQMAPERNNNTCPHGAPFLSLTLLERTIWPISGQHYRSPVLHFKQNFQEHSTCTFPRCGKQAMGLVVLESHRVFPTHRIVEIPLLELLNEELRVLGVDFHACIATRNSNSNLGPLPQTQSQVAISQATPSPRAFTVKKPSL